MPGDCVGDGRAFSVAATLVVNLLAHVARTQLNCIELSSSEHAWERLYHVGIRELEFV